MFESNWWSLCDTNGEPVEWSEGLRVLESPGQVLKTHPVQFEVAWEMYVRKPVKTIEGSTQSTRYLFASETVSPQEYVTWRSPIAWYASWSPNTCRNW